MLELEFIPTNPNEDSTFVQMNENTYDEIKDILDFMENEQKFFWFVVRQINQSNSIRALQGK